VRGTWIRLSRHQRRGTLFHALEQGPRPYELGCQNRQAGKDADDARPGCDEHDHAQQQRGAANNEHGEFPRGLQDHRWLRTISALQCFAPEGRVEFLNLGA
jgi:hypothetical protein